MRWCFRGGGDVTEARTPASRRGNTEANMGSDVGTAQAQAP